MNAIDAVSLYIEYSSAVILNGTDLAIGNYY